MTGHLLGSMLQALRALWTMRHRWAERHNPMATIPFRKEDLDSLCWQMMPSGELVLPDIQRTLECYPHSTLLIRGVSAGPWRVTCPGHRMDNYLKPCSSLRACPQVPTHDPKWCS
eukprot:XP_001704990.1 Hypothetical protein GL50803_98122 [Giardia lamblia ATCC 50803]